MAIVHSRWISSFLMKIIKATEVVEALMSLESISSLGGIVTKDSVKNFNLT